MQAAAWTNHTMSKTTAKKAPKMKFKKAPGAPKRFKSAFLFFSEYKHKMIREGANNKKIRAAEAAKVVSQAWKDLSDQDRAQWLELGRADRERYEREKAAYKGPWKIPDIKDPNAPKKPMSAFLAFGNERRGLIAEANPTLTNTEISSLLSKLWKECPAHMKQAYRNREARERAVFKKRFSEWERKREEALVMDHHSNNSVSADGDDETSDDTTATACQPPQAPIQETAKSLLQQHGSQFVPLPTQSALNFYQSWDIVPNEMPANVFLPTSRVDQPTTAHVVHETPVDHDLMSPQQACLFDRHNSSATLPPMIALPEAPPTTTVSWRFANYSMDDILQDDELFFEDFSPCQVLSNNTPRHS